MRHLFADPAMAGTNDGRPVLASLRGLALELRTGKSDPAATLELLQREFRLMLGHLECSSVDELSTTVLEEQPHNLMFRASD